MSHWSFIIYVLALFGGLKTNLHANNHITPPIDSIQRSIDKLAFEVDSINVYYTKKLNVVYTKVDEINFGDHHHNTNQSKLEYLIKKDSLNQVIKRLKQNNFNAINKIRYIKGLEIIKLLYNKTLALDHHFSSVSTFQEISQIANPNHYSVFRENQRLNSINRNKKNGFELTEILGNNIYASITHSLISLFTNTTTNKKEKEERLKGLECILDFSLRMTNDLNTIYFETVFLEKSNQSVMLHLDQLFTDFTKPIGYTKSLKECRKNDDWDTVRNYLTIYVNVMEKEVAFNRNSTKAYGMRVNLEFPIDQLLQFIIRYNSFIEQGSKFYEKFAIMLNSYENQNRCAGQIPAGYQHLKDGITVAIEKFATAYKPIEINGSKLKQLLYGISEYD